MTYLAEQQRILDRHDTATAARAKNAAMRDLLTHAQDHGDLIDQIAGHASRPVGDTPRSQS